MSKKKMEPLFRPRIPDETDATPTDGDLIAGDVHGDLDGLKGALSKAGYNPDKHRLWSVGDNIDRGHQSKEMMDFMDHYGVGSVLGNHEWAHHRYGKHMMNAAVTGKKIPMKVTPEMEDTKRQLGDDYLKYSTKFGNYPLYLPFQDSQGSGYIVHGGIDPEPSEEHMNQSPDDEMRNQSYDSMLVRRFHPSPNVYIPNETKEFPYWQRSYNGHLGAIIHGHAPMSHPQNDHGNPNVYSLDGGGVFGSLANWGGKHRVMKLGSRQIYESPGSPEAEVHYRQILARKNGTI